MNYPYFSQYMAVPGLWTKEDDLVFFKVNGKWTEATSADTLLGKDIEAVQKAALCLCSYEIKPGDTVTNRYDGTTSVIKNNATRRSIDLLASCNEYKLVGVIMTAGIKAGLRFSEGEKKVLSIKPITWLGAGDSKALSEKHGLPEALLCPCGGHMFLNQENRPYKYKDVAIDYMELGYTCRNCEESYTTTESATVSQQLAKEKYPDLFDWVE